MSRREHFDSLVSRIRYKDWEFKIADDESPLEVGGLFLRLHWVCDGIRQSSRRWYLSPWSTDAEVVQTALLAVLTAEEHEARERFLFDGRPIFGPHHSLRQLLFCAEDREKRRDARSTVE